MSKSYGKTSKSPRAKTNMKREAEKSVISKKDTTRYMSIDKLFKKGKQ